MEKIDKRKDERIKRDGFDVKNTPLTSEQITNYLQSDNHKKDLRHKVKDILDEPMSLSEMNLSQKQKVLATGLSYLNVNRDKERIYRRILILRLRKVSFEVLAKVLRVKPAQVKALERDAIECIKDKMNTQIIKPVVL